LKTMCPRIHLRCGKDVEEQLGEKENWPVKTLISRAPESPSHKSSFSNLRTKKWKKFFNSLLTYAWKKRNEVNRNERWWWQILRESWSIKIFERKTGPTSPSAAASLRPHFKQWAQERKKIRFAKTVSLCPTPLTNDYLW
jgi:hypothetical protein